MAEMISKQHLLEQIDTTGKGCEYEGKEFLAYQEAMLAVVELIEKEPTVEKEYDVMFSGTEHIDSPGPAPVVGYRIAAKSWEEAVQKGKFYAEMQHPAFIPFAFAGPVIEVPKEELENLENYFAILRIRYAGSFEYSFHVEDDELLSCLVPKLILQPLAENSVMHGSSDDGSVMEIHITCWEEDGHMLLELQDDGKGFEITRTDLNPHKDRKKIGVANVNDRIQLNFGREYGLKIDSHPCEGTTCTLTLPKLYADTLSQQPEE